jgi:hypothetical protein
MKTRAFAFPRFPAFPTFPRFPDLTREANSAANRVTGKRLRGDRGHGTEGHVKTAPGSFYRVDIPSVRDEYGFDGRNQRRRTSPLYCSLCTEPVPAVTPKATPITAARGTPGAPRALSHLNFERTTSSWQPLPQ